jgi:hypothetical protein
MKLKKYFYYWIIGMIVLIVLFAVFGPKVKRLDLKSINFISTESAELYFKNIRSFSYDRVENEKVNFILYRIKSREKDTTVFGLNFLIVSNWLQDENYILAEFQPYNFISYGLYCENESGSDTIRLNGSDVEAHYVFAANFYEQLSADSRFFYHNNQESLVELVISEEQRKSLEKSLKDYFKLVGKLR